MPINLREVYDRLANVRGQKRVAARENFETVRRALVTASGLPEDQVLWKRGDGSRTADVDAACAWYAGTGKIGTAVLDFLFEETQPPNEFLIAIDVDENAKGEMVLKVGPKEYRQLAELLDDVTAELAERLERYMR